MRRGRQARQDGIAALLQWSMGLRVRASSVSRAQQQLPKPKQVPSGVELTYCLDVCALQANSKVLNICLEVCWIPARCAKKVAWLLSTCSKLPWHALGGGIPKKPNLCFFTEKHGYLCYSTWRLLHCKARIHVIAYGSGYDLKPYWTKQQVPTLPTPTVADNRAIPTIFFLGEG